MSASDLILEPSAPQTEGAPPRRVASNTAWAAGSLAVSFGLTALSYAVLARQLSPPAFGVELGFLGAAIFLWALVDFGQIAWAVRELANSDTPPARFAEIMETRVTIALSAACAWAAGCAVAHVALGTSAYVILYGAWIGLSLLYSALLVPDRVEENLRPPSVALVLEKVVTLGVVLLVVVAGVGTPSLAGAMALGGVAASAYAFRRRDGVSLCPARLSLTIQHLRSSLPFAAASIAAQIQRLDVALVALFATPLQAGLYAAPARLAQPLQALPVAFSQATFARGARAGVMRTERSSFHRGLLFLLAAETALVLPVLVAPQLVVTTVLGEKYAGAAETARLIGLALLAGAATLPLASALQASGLSKFVGRAMLLLSTLALIPMSAGAYLDGATGAAAGSIVAGSLTSTVLAFKWFQLRPSRRDPAGSASPRLLPSSAVEHDRKGS